jgi:hypothetical protein
MIVDLLSGEAFLVPASSLASLAITFVMIPIRKTVS